MQVDRMENEALKQVFRKLQAKITEEVDPNCVIDKLFAKNIISAQHFNDLCTVSNAKGRCSSLLALLHLSSHPETFIQLRNALRNEYPRIVDEIDEQLKSQLTPQPQRQLQLSRSTEGKLLIVLRSLLSYPVSKTHWATHRRAIFLC